MISDEQTKIITADVNCINIITAGPGSGKTSVLVNRAIYLMNNVKDSSHMILLLTYSREACNQLKDRIASSVNNSLDRFKIDTYHSLSFYLLKRYYKLIGYSNVPKKANEKEIIQLIDIFLVSNSNLFYNNGEAIDSKKLLKVIKIAKEKYVNLSTSDESIEMSFKALENSSSFIKLYSYLHASLKRDNKIMDFCDMISEAILLLKSENNRTMILNELKFRYILVDEFQDTNYRQLQLLKLIMDRAPFLTVVGDRDQLIYKFQGANEHNWAELTKHLNSLNVSFITSQLNNNFRSSSVIVKCSNIMINSNKQNSNQKKSVAVGEYSSNGNPLSIIECSSEKDQYSFIAKQILELTKDSNSPNRIAMNEIAVLYRNNNKGEAFMNYLKGEFNDVIKINHKKYIDVTNINTSDGEGRRNVIMNKLKLINNLNDNNALKNCLPISKNDKCNEVVNSIIVNAQKHNGSIFNAIDNAVKQKIKHIGPMKNFCKSVLELQNWMLGNEITLQDFITKLCNSIHDAIDPNDLTAEKLMDLLLRYDRKNFRNLSQEVPMFIDSIDNSGHAETTKSSSLWVSTIHCAKGLEFRYVFLLEANNDIFQSSNNGNDNELELLYVAISRAKEKLFITWISNSNNIHNGISEFLRPLVSSSLLLLS